VLKLKLIEQMISLLKMSSYLV